MPSAVPHAPSVMAPIALPGSARDGETRTLGRDAKKANIVIDHPSVSRGHAALTRAQGAWQIEDLQSSNGTFVSGARIASPMRLVPGMRVDVGAISYTFTGEALQPVAGNAGAALRIESLSYTPRGDNAPKLLDRIDLSLKGSGLLCILGPSGSGKSTLLRAIGGRISPSAGNVFVDEINLHAQYDRVKHRVGYVPQHEALREELTVGDMLRYTSRLRLTSDVSRDEIEVSIEQLCARVGLAERIDTSIRALSGGQRRRVGLMNELLARPSLVLLDEVTSGLDEEAAHIIMSLVREFASDGMTVLCVTHTVEAVEPYADTVLVLAPGGVPSFLGPPSELLSAFDVAKVGDLYARLRQRPAEEWRRKLIGAGAASVAPARTATTESVAGAPLATRLARGMRSTFVLSARYIDVLIGDSRSLGLALAQGIAIGLALRLLFGGDELPLPRNLQLGFLVVMSSFWFGCNNSVKEIVKERALLAQEWAAGLPLFAYGLSKVLVLGLLAAVQVLLLLVTLALTGIRPEHATTLAALGVLGAWTGTAVGLLVSARARTTDAANVALPLLLIPQFLFAEALVAPLTEAARWLARVSISAFWLYEGVRATLSVPDANLNRAVMMLGAHGLVALVAALLILHHSMRAEAR